MPTAFKNKLLSEIGSLEQKALTTEAGVKTTVLGISLTNLTGSIILVSIRLSDNVENTSAFFIKEIIVPPNQSLRVVNGGEKLILGGSTDLYISSNVDESLDAVISYVEVS
jgi:hypothetical protein